MFVEIVALRNQLLIKPKVAILKLKKQSTIAANIERGDMRVLIMEYHNSHRQAEFIIVIN